MKVSLQGLFRKIKKPVSLVLVLAVLFGIAVTPAGAEESPASDSEIYGMLYYADTGKQNTDGSYKEEKNIELVLQKGNQPDNSKTLVVDSDGKKGIVQYSKVDAYPSWYRFAPTANNYNIIQVDFKDKLRPTSIAGWFRNCKLLTEDSFKNKQNLDTSECTDMQYAFYLCSGMESIDFTQWENFTADKVRKLSYFLSDCTAIKTADLTPLHPAECTEATYVFKNCYALEKVKLNNFNVTANIKGKAYMNNFFMNCRKLETVGNEPDDSVDLSQFAATHPMSYDSMFRGCTSLRKADLSKIGKYNTNSAVYISHMFYDCTSLEEIDMSNFEIEFSPRNFLVNARALRELKIPDVSKTNNLGKNESRDLFQYADKLAYVELSENWKANGTLRMPAKTEWKKTKLSNNLGSSDQEPLNTEKTATDLFQNFKKEYAGGWSAAAEFEFKGNGGTPESQTVTGEKNKELDISTVTQPTRDGYNFKGWYSEPEGGEKFNGTAKHWTYYAQWEDIEYELVLNANGGKNPVTNETEIQRTVKYSDWVELGNTGFVNGNKVLVGWNTNASGNGVSYSALDSVGMLTPKAGTFTLYAIWGENAATVDFEPQGGSKVSPKNYSQLPANYGALSVSEKDHYTFMGWYTAADGGEKIEENSPVMQSCTLYAHWERNPVVTLHPNGGYFSDGDTTPETRECAYNGTVGYLSVPSHGTASLLGWFTQPIGGERITSETVVTSDMTIYAHWGYLPVLDTDGGVIEGSFEGFEGAGSPSNYEITELPTVHRDNYTFKGWYHGNTPVEPGSKIDLSSDKIIKASWTQDETAVITLDPNGGTLPEGAAGAITVYKGNTVAALPSPVKENCDFEGWYKSGSDERVTAETVIDSDLTLRASWKTLDCTVTFHPGKGTILGDSVIKVANGKVPDYIPGIYNPAVGETFLGWFTQPDGKGDKLWPDTVIKHDTDYYPYWETRIEHDEATGVNFLAQWDTVSDTGVTDVGDYLVFYPGNNNKVTATLKVVLMMDGVVQTPVPENTLRLKIPRYVFKGYGDPPRPVGTDNMAALATANYTMTIEDDFYVFTNKVPLRSVFDTFTIDYTVSPRDVPGGYEDENRLFQGNYYKNTDIQVSLEIDRDKDNVPENTYPQTLGLEFHTLVHTNASKSRSNVTFDWNESWGPRPADAEEYFYVTWLLTSDHSNTSSQRYKLLWDENTVGRDGSIVYTSGAVGYKDNEGSWTGWRTNGRNNAYVVTKHRRDEAIAQTSADGDKWAEVKNEAILNVLWESGHKEQFRVNATATAYIPPSGSGAYSFTKTVPNANNNQAHYIHGGQELILNGEADNMPKLPYEVKYTENYNVDNPGWDPETEQYKTGRTMTLTDCSNRLNNDVMISSCSSDFKQDTWENCYGLVDGDYCFDKLTINVTEFDAKKMGEHWSNPYEHNPRSEYKATEVYVRKQNSDDFVIHQSAQVPKEGWTVTLPPDTAGFKIVHTTTAYSANISVKTNICLKPTSRLTQFVAAAVKNGQYTIIKNKAEMLVEPYERDYKRTLKTSDNGSWPASYVLDMSSISLYARKDCADNDNDITYDAETLTAGFPAVISGWNYNNSGNKTPFRSGVFYDLLPKDYTVEKDSVFVKPIKENWSEAYYNNTAKIKANKYDSEIKSGTLPKGAYSVQLVENWEGTGRTMMIVKVSVPDSILATGVNVYYQMKVRYSSVYSNGVTQMNTVVFCDTTDGQIAPESKSTGINEGDVPAELVSHFTQFEGPNTAFASDNTHTVQPPVRESGLNTAVYTEESGMTEHELVGLNTDYSYHITYSSGANSTSKELVFYNVLERRIDGAESEWYGKFLGVDVSAIEAVENANNANAKCQPVVYYSTAPRESFTRQIYPREDDSFNLDLPENSGLWTTEMPANPSDVTAIAVDCRTDNKGEKFFLAPEKTLDFKINMKSTDDKTKKDLFAYNETVIRYTLADKQDRVHLLSKTDVRLQFGTPLLDKTSFPSSGTAEKPASVVKGSTLNYTLKITNPDGEISMNDIHVSDSFDTAKVKPVPEGIMARLGDEADALIDRHVRIKSYSLGDDGKFSAVISNLEPGETLYITIPVNVTGSDKAVIENTAEITSVNGVEFDVHSPATYHVIDALKLKVMKVNSKGEPLEGAKLTILNYDGTEAVPEFTSGTEPKIFEISEGSYILRETAAPSGYKPADDISFLLAKDGRVYIDGSVYDSVTMVNEPGFKVIFHENHQEQSDKNVVFRIFEPQDLTDQKVLHFYDIPVFAGDEYVFAGWYHNNGYTQTDSPDSAELPADFEHDKFTAANTSDANDSDYHLYAKWIKVGKVEKDGADTNIFSGGYRGFGLAGVQIRQEKGPDGEEMYDPNQRDEGIGGEEYNNYGKKTPAGLRFVTSLSESLLAGIHNIGKIATASDEANSFGVEYGYVVGLAENISEFVRHYNADPAGYRLQYQGENVNGVDTTGKDRKPETDYRYISNVNCTSKQKTTEKTGVVLWDHRNFDDYRLYTLVVTYEGAESEKSKYLNARAYIRYYDANGKLRVFYNSYRNNVYYGGCMCSFSQVAG